MNRRLNRVSEEGLKNAAEALFSGGVIIFPTDTVYGLGTLPWNLPGVEKIYDIKGRPLEKRLGLYFSTPSKIAEWADLDDYEVGILSTHLPGPYTFVVRASKDPPKPLAPGFFGDTIGVRCPDHTDCLRLLTECGGVMAGTSANLSGGHDAGSVGEIDETILASADAILDSGPAILGKASTVVDIRGRRILRQGVAGFIFPSDR